MTNGKRKLVSSYTGECSRPLASVLGKPGRRSSASSEDTRATSVHSQCQPWPDTGCLGPLCTLWAVDQSSAEETSSLCPLL